MGERRTIDPEAPGVVELELDEGLEDTMCLACWAQVPRVRRRAKGCPHTTAERAAAARDVDTQQVAQIVGRAPVSDQVAALRRSLGWRPWWSTAEGRERIRRWLESLRRG